ncbi:MAG: acyl-CoA desaturase [Planctomycetia bacterium]|nr:acyl-CoA desaturase [Planctomycetia bacterium]
MFRGVLPPDAKPNRAATWVELSLRSGPFILLHLLALVAFWTPLTWTAAILYVSLFSLRTFGLTAGYHRYFAHRGYSTSRIFQFMLAWFGCCAVQKGPLWWAGHHRSHHRYSDTPKDPHSPHETSFWWSHVGWILSNEYTETPYEDIPDFSRYPELRWIDTFHIVPGITLAILCWLIGGMPGLVYGFLLSTITLYHTTFSVNSLNHLFGSRRYATPDDSRNNLWIALLTFGEGWHNNHHHYQSSANQGFYWWEIDISYSILVVLSKFGIVWNLRTPGNRALNYRRIRPTAKVTSLEQMAATAEGAGNGSRPLDGGTASSTAS